MTQDRPPSAEQQIHAAGKPGAERQSRAADRPGAERQSQAAGADRIPLLLRSMLFVPGDSERKLAKAHGVAADALILDLEDSVAPARKPHARALVAEFLGSIRTPGRASGGTLGASGGAPETLRGAAGGTPGRTLWVRISPLDDLESRADLDSMMPGRPDGIVLPKPHSPDDVVRLDARLDDLERRLDIATGSTLILPIATETPASVFALARYAGCSPRLAAMTWGAEDLGTALGAAATVDGEGDWLAPYQLVRALCLLAAANAGVPAIDSVYTELRNEAGLLHQARAAKRDGFAGKLAIHPRQVEIFNETFSPALEEIERARRVIEAFAASPHTGVVALDGRMLDLPHLVRARRIVALAHAVSAEAERNRG